MNEISEVQITIIKPNNGLVGFASLLLDRKLYLSSIGIHQKLDGSGYRLTYPNRKVGMQSLDVYHPVNRELGLAIETAVISRFKEVMSKNDRHNSVSDS